jgi:hypothetical protein
MSNPDQVRPRGIVQGFGEPGISCLRQLRSLKIVDFDLQMEIRFF